MELLFSFQNQLFELYHLAEQLLEMVKLLKTYLFFAFFGETSQNYRFDEIALRRNFDAEPGFRTQILIDKK